MVRKLFDIISEVFGIDSSKISDETAQKDISRWDSLNALLLIDAIEKEYNVKFTIDEVIEISKVRDIKNILQKHNITNF